MKETLKLSDQENESFKKLEMISRKWLKKLEIPQTKGISHLFSVDHFAFHQTRHSEGVAKRAYEIAEFLEFSEKDKQLLKIMGFHHDTVQNKNDQGHRLSIQNEGLSGLLLVKLMELENKRLKTEFYTKQDRLDVLEGILGTVADFTIKDQGKETAFQPLLEIKKAENEGFLPQGIVDEFLNTTPLNEKGIILALADLGEAAMSPERFGPFGDAYALEEGIPNLAAMFRKTDDLAQKDPNYEKDPIGVLLSKMNNKDKKDICEKITNWSKGQISFIQGRKHLVLGNNPENNTIEGELAYLLDNRDEKRLTEIKTLFLKNFDLTTQLAHKSLDRRQQLLENNNYDIIIKEFLERIISIQPIH